MTSLTGNEVKFLVSLGINETKSKKEINDFISKTLEKENKLVFGVNKAQSNKNISKFLSERKQDTQQLIFGVNQGASLAKITSGMNELRSKLGHIEVMLGVDYTASMVNINKFIETAKVNPKVIDLAIDENTKKNLNVKIDNLKLNKAMLKFKLTKDSFTEIDKKLSEKVFKGVKVVADLDIKKTMENITSKISAMKLPNVALGSDVPKDYASRKTSTAPTTDAINPYVGDTSKYFEASSKEAQKLEAEYAKLNKTVEIFNTTRAEGEDIFIAKLKANGRQVQITRDEETGAISKIVTTYKNAQNQIEKEFFTPLKHDFVGMGSDAQKANLQLEGFVKTTSTLNDSNELGFRKNLSKLIDELKEAERASTITKKSFDEMWARTKSDNFDGNKSIEEMRENLKKLRDEQARQISLTEKQHKLRLQQEQLLSNLTRTERMYIRTVNKEEAESIRQRIAQIRQMQALNVSKSGMVTINDDEFRKAQSAINDVRGDVRRLNAEATEATKNSMGIIDAMKVAFERFPIWMVASTAFYGTIRTVREFGTIILDLDTKMTELKKVMAEGTDFGEIFRSATKDAETFGQTISSTLDAYAMFAKQGYSGDELSTLAQSALVGGNVGDIDTGKMAEYLTASMAQWNKETSEAMGIVDSWNELSNDYATTVENLAQGQAKAGSTAQAMGLEFNQLTALIGMMNAKTKQSGNEIGNFIKGTLPNLISSKGQGILADLGVQLEDESGNLRDIIEVYRDVAKEYQKLSQAEQNQVVLGLGGKYHISRLQTLLNDLGSVDSMYDNMYNSAENSANSAMNENAIYMESLQARINLARVEVEKLATAIGEAVMTEAMVSGLQLFSTAVSGVSNFVSEFGVLPATLLAGVSALTLFSNRFGDTLKNMESGQGVLGRYVGKFKEFTASTVDAVSGNKALDSSQKDTNQEIERSTVIVDSNTQATKKNTADTDNNTKSLDKSTEAKNRAGRASKLLSASFGALGLASIAIGYGVEFLLKKYGEARQAKEDLMRKTEQENKNYADNREQIQALATEYQNLIDKQNSGTLSTEEFQELLDVQNKLAELLPSLNTLEDEYGNKVIVSTTQVGSKVSLLERQLALQEKINEAKDKELRLEEQSQARNNIEDSESDINGELTKAYTQINAYSELFEKIGVDIKEGVDRAGNVFTGFQIKDIESFEVAIANLQKTLDSESLSSDERDQVEKLMGNLNSTYVALLESQGLALSSLDTLRGAYVSSIEDIANSNGEMSDSGSEAFMELSNSILGLAENEGDLKKVEDAIRMLFSSTRGEATGELFESISQKIKAMKDSGITDLDTLEKKFGTSLAKIRQDMLVAFSGAGIKKGTSEYNALVTALDNYINTGYGAVAVTDSFTDAQGRSIEQANNMLATNEDTADSFTMAQEEIDKYVASMENFSSTGEKLLGVTDKQVNESKELISIYSSLSSVSNRTKEQQEALSESIQKLNALYPHLVSNGKVRIENIQEEIKFNGSLLEAHKNLTDGKLTSEEEMTYYSALGTKARIENLQAELLAMEKVAGKSYEKYAEIMKKHESGAELSTSEQNFLMQASMNRGEFTGYADYSKAVAELEAGLGKLNSSLNNVEKSNVRVASSENKKAESTKKAKKETSEIAKATDKYALAQERLNTAMAKVQDKLKSLAPHSQAYRNALDEENKLIRQQIDLNNQKINDLSKVKNSTKTTTTNSSSSSSSSGKTVVPSGSQGKITAPYNQKRTGYSHQGIDLDGAIGDRLDAFVAGEVIKTGKTSRSGNFVQILDSQGVKHFYAHLDSIAVKFGQMVDVGTKIGEIGNTGNVVKGKGGDGSHLHYETKNSKGQYIDPTQFVMNARKGKTTSGIGGGTSTTSTTTGNEREEALQQIEKLKQENIALANSSKENYFDKINSSLSGFQKERDKQSDSISRQGALQERMLETSKEYEESVNRQYSAEKNKIKLYQQEDAFLAKTLKAGGLNEKQVVELRDRRLEIKNLIYDAQNQETAYFEQVVSSYMARYSKSVSDINTLLSIEENRLESLDSTSKDYEKTLKNMAKARQDQTSVLREELSYVLKQISSGKLSAKAYEEMKNRVNELKNEILDATQAMQALNYEMVQAVGNSFDIKIDDTDFDLEYIRSMRESFDDMSGDFLNSLNMELDLLPKKLELVEQKGREMQQAMKNKDLGIKELQELEEQLEENALAYLSIKSAIRSAEKEVEAFNKRIEEQIDKLQDDLADNIIDSLKKAVKKARDIATDAVDDLIEKEDERHEKAMKNFDNELKAYQKLIDSRRREIDDSDRDRTFNNNLADLEKEKKGYQDRLNAISNVNTFEAQRERKELDEKIADVSKRIAEENYQYEKTLREQQLDDLMDAKEESIDIQKEQETESHNNLVKSLNKQKKAWEKYYDDLLDNEKLFSQMREMILQGNFDEVESMFMQHVGALKFELPGLEAEFKSTWDAVSNGIRTTVLTSFDSMQSKIRETTSAIEKLRNAMKSISGFEIPDVNMTVENNTGDGSSGVGGGLSDADLKVILAKFMNEQIAGKLDPTKDKARIANIKGKASTLAQQGRDGGSAISDMTSLDGVLSSLTPDQIKQVGSYFSKNASSSGFSTKEYNDYIKAFGQNAQSTGSLMTGGDLQVMTAKYIREKLMPTAKDAKTKEALRVVTDSMANSGRNNLSLISSTTGFDAQFGKLTSQQKQELGSYMMSNSNVVADSSLRKMLESYGKKIASMDVGGMTKGFGSSGGVDGKGGRFGILHQNEIINNPLDTERMLKVSSLLDNIMNTIGRVTAIPSAPTITNTTNNTTSGDRPIQINIDKYTGSKSDLDNLLKQVDNRLKRERGRG